MLTKKQNMLETVHGGNPDRFVNQYEAVNPMRAEPIGKNICNLPTLGGPATQDAWGVWRIFKEGQPGCFPLHDADHILLKDICEWRDVIKKPNVKFADSEWEGALENLSKVDTNEQFITLAIQPGVFENTHYFQSMVPALENYLMEPEESKELVKYLFEYEMEIAEQYITHLHPEAIIHHDDWGTQISTFMRPEMFDEFFLEGYKQLYGYYHDNGVKLIIHHSDSYAETLIPEMIEMGIDVWQGTMSSNDIPAITEKYAGQLTIMGGIDCMLVDTPDSTPEHIEEVVRQKIEQNGQNGGYIPCITSGGPVATYPGVYDTITKVINQVNKEKFGMCSDE